MYEGALRPTQRNNMKGIILAGGSGTRLYPITKGVSKQLVPIYDKPMVYYPLSVLMLAGITEVLIISTPDDLPNFERLLGDGSDLGMKFEYIVQPSPDGLAQAFILGADFIGDDDACLILGDNIYYGHDLIKTLNNAVLNAKQGHATVFGYHVHDPERYGVAGFDANGNVKKDSLGNDIKKDKLVTIKATVLQNTQLKESNVNAVVQLKDKRTLQIVDRFPVNSNFVFTYLYGSVYGDRRALDANYIETLNPQAVPFPSDEQMVYETGEDLKLNIKQILMRIDYD